MVTPFEFATAGRILFGPGKVRELPAVAKALGARALIVCGRDSRRGEPAAQVLSEAGLGVEIFSVPGEPDIDTILAGAERARAMNADLVVGFGGGSALDAAKAVAALAVNQRPVYDYLEVIGKGLPLERTPMPVIAVPTTAGTGAEVTRNAVLFSPEHRVKVSLRHPAMLPRVAIVDPELTFDLPPALTASTGMDALTQLIEPFVCSRANAVTDALCRQAIPIAAKSLPRAFTNSADASARSGMALASLFGGLALANAGLGAVHGFAAPIGGMFSAPHGAVCAALLPHVMAQNVRAAAAANRADVLGRYDEVAQLLTHSSAARGEEGIGFVAGLCRQLNIPTLRSYGIRQCDLAGIASKAAGASSMKANPVALTHEELVATLAAAL